MKMKKLRNALSAGESGRNADGRNVNATMCISTRKI